MLSPKIHRYSIFPRKCIQPPCRNIELKIVIQAGTDAKPGSSSTVPNKWPGISPNVMVAASPPSPNDSCHKKARAQAAIRP